MDAWTSKHEEGPRPVYSIPRSNGVSIDVAELPQHRVRQRLGCRIGRGHVGEDEVVPDISERLLDRLTQGAPNRMVIFDSPPALAASPAAELAKYVGQAVLVVRADSTGQSAIEDALHLLSNCPDIKLLLNAAMFSPSGRRFGSYYGYGG